MTLTPRLSIFATSVFAFVSLSTPAQQPPSTASPTADIYSREASVLDRVERIYTYAADGTGNQDVTVVADIRNAAALKSWSIVGAGFASASEHVEIDYLRVRRPDGTVVVTPASDAQEQPLPITREAPFYSDLKSIQIPVRGLREGDHLEYHLRIIRTKPEAPGHFWHQESLLTPSSGAVVRQEVVELRIPKGVYVQTWSPKHTPTISETATEKVFRWESHQLTPVAGKTKEDLLRADPEAMVLDEFGDRLPAIQWSNFHTWAEVGAWYRGMESSRMEPDDDVRARVKDLTAGKSTPEEKTRAIYGFVAPQVRYIGVAFGIGRFQPHPAGEVLSNQYGDCKDKHTLLAAMLSAAGIPADAILIGAGVAFNEALPSPASFNHVITLAHVDGKPVWLDATAEVAPYEMLMAPIRGKQGLRIPATGAAEIVRTPKDPPFKAEIHFVADGTLDEHGTSHSHMVMDLRGDEEIAYRQAVRSVSPAQYDELMQHVSESMNYSGKVSHTEFSRPDDTAAPFHVAYDYEREKSGDWDNYRILAQLPPAGLGMLDEKNPPIVPISLGTPHVEIDRAVMKLPAGWGANLPPSVHAKSIYATLDKTYKLEDGKLIAERRVEILLPRVPAAEWRDYQKWATDASLDSEPYIKLNRTGGSRAEGENNPKAEALIREAGTLEQESNWKAARERLDEAKAINPHQAYLWSNYGYITMMNGKLSDAISDFQHELAEHPDEDNVSLLLARTQMQQHKTQDATATLQALAARNPGNEAGASLLSTILLDEKQYPAAEKALRNTLAGHPDSVPTQLSLTTALVRQGKKEEATALLKTVVEKSNDAALLNNAAYTLADENLDIPLSEKAARRSLSLLEEQVANAPQGDSDPSALARTEAIISVWDTLGWVLFREGKIEEAEHLIRAAWVNGMSAESGYHLGLILEKEGHPDKAMAVYQVAFFGDRGSNAATVANNNIERQAALKKAGTPKQVSDGKSALQAQRTFKLPTPSAENGWATVEIEFTAAGASTPRILKDDKTHETPTQVVPALQNVAFKLEFPPGSHAKITRRGVLSCHSGTPCEFVLLSTGSALSTGN